MPGIVTCTKRFCGSIPKIRNPGSAVTSCGIVNGQQRSVGDTWEDDCNNCVCRDNGVATCTKRFCGNIPVIRPNGSVPQLETCVTIKNVPCRFPFIYKGVSYDKCTYTDTINQQPWCATVGTVRLTRSGAVLGSRQVGDCDLSSNCQVEEEEADYEDQTDSESYGPCTFSHDCLGEGGSCEHIADATCVCNFGRCLVRGYDIERWVGGVQKTRVKQCEKHQDCPCRNETEKCFCIDDKCVNESWECHDDKECSKLAKCDGKQCTCTAGTCEWQCATTEDCVNKNDAFYCQHLGYECKCSLGQCESVELPEDCVEPAFGVEDPEAIHAGLEACVALGKCMSDEPCQCLNNHCTTPWYATEDGDCRENTGVKDCSDTVLDCIGDKCLCENVIQIDAYTRLGVCAPNPSK